MNEKDYRKLWRKNYICTGHSIEDDLAIDVDYKI